MISGGKKGDPLNKTRAGVVCGETRGSSLLPEEQGFWTPQQTSGSLRVSELTVTREHTASS